MAIIKFSKSTTVAEFKENFYNAFGVKLRIYGNGRSQMADDATLEDAGLTKETNIDIDKELRVCTLCANMKGMGLKVKVYTCDDWVAVLDELTLAEASKVKKGAVKADMEMILANRVGDAVTTNGNEVKKVARYANYIINILSDNSISVLKDGNVCGNTKATLREIADETGFVYEEDWTTRQFGSKLVSYLNSNTKETPKMSHVHDEDEDLDNEPRCEENNTRKDERENQWLVSKIFASLAYAIADVDDNIDEEEIEMILGVASKFEEYDEETVKQGLMLEKMRVVYYDSHTALAKQLPEEYRMNMFKALTMVAVSDFKVKQDELSVLTTLSKIWDIDKYTANIIVNDIVNKFASFNSNRDLEIE